MTAQKTANKRKTKGAGKLQDSKVASLTTKPNNSKKGIENTTEPSVDVQHNSSQPQLSETDQKHTETIIESKETVPEKPTGKVPDQNPHPNITEEKAPLDSAAIDNMIKRKHEIVAETSQDRPVKRRKNRMRNRKLKKEAPTDAVPMEVETEKEVNPALADTKDTETKKIAKASETNKRKRENESQNQKTEATGEKVNAEKKDSVKEKSVQNSPQRLTKREKRKRRKMSVAKKGSIEDAPQEVETKTVDLESELNEKAELEEEAPTPDNIEAAAVTEVNDEAEKDSALLQTQSQKLTKSQKAKLRKQAKKPVTEGPTKEARKEADTKAVDVESEVNEKTEPEDEAPTTDNIETDAPVPEVNGEAEKDSAPLQTQSQKLTKSQKAKLKKQAKKPVTEMEPQTQKDTPESKSQPSEPNAVPAEATTAEDVAAPSNEASKTKPKPKKKRAAKAPTEDKVEEKESTEEPVTTPKDIDAIFANKKSKPASAITVASNDDEKRAMETFVNTITNVKSGKKPAKPKADDGFADSRGSKSRRRTTDDGLPIYEDKELLAVDGGETAECPFDCKCCY